MTEEQLCSKVTVMHLVITVFIFLLLFCNLFYYVYHKSYLSFFNVIVLLILMGCSIKAMLLYRQMNVQEENRFTAETPANDKPQAVLTLGSKPLAVPGERVMPKRKEAKDPLTSLYTYTYFYESLDEEIERAIRYKYGLAIIFARVDNLSQISENYGEETAMNIITEAAEAIRRTIRDVDMAAVCEFGKFSLILAGVDRNTAPLPLKRIGDRINQQIQSRGNTDISITLSAGISLYPQHGENKTTLIHRAEDALKQAMDEGGNKICIF